MQHTDEGTEALENGVTKKTGKPDFKQLVNFGVSIPFATLFLGDGDVLI